MRKPDRKGRHVAQTRVTEIGKRALESHGWKRAGGSRAKRKGARR
jgi:hypothetical protein